MLVGVMVLGVVACGKKEEPVTEEPVIEDVVEEEVVEGEVDLEDTEIALSETELLITKIYEKVQLEFPVMTMLLDPANDEDPEYFKSFTGLETAENVEQASVSEALISSQAYSLVLVKATEDADVAAMAEEMINGVNPAKWVCVQADDVKVVTEGRYICLVMISSEYAEQATAESLTNGFISVVTGADEVPAEATEEVVEVETEAETVEVEAEETTEE